MHNDKQYRSLLILLLCAGLTGGCSTSTIHPQPQPKSKPSRVVVEEVKPVQPPPKPVVISVAAVGDIMLGTDYPNDRLPPKDGEELLRTVAPILQTADITFGNLEGVLLDGGEPVKRCVNPSLCYLFRTPTRYVRYLQQAGFDVLSLANNHARDFGEQGRTLTMHTLDTAGIRHSGRAGDIASWVHKGVRVALIAFAPFGGSNDLLGIEAAKKKVASLAVTHDVVLVSMHAGAEGADVMRIPFAHEYYYGEDRGDVVEFAHAVIDAGADLVLGHGPHVPRAIELYKGRLVAYSLGNFSTYIGFDVTEVKGLAPILMAKLRQDGSFISGRIISGRQQRPLGPVIDSSHEAARLIMELMRQDFPNTPLTITTDGYIKLSPQTQVLPSHTISNQDR